MKLIPLSQGKFSKVDDDDFEMLSSHKWHYRNGYALRSVWKGLVRGHIYMHAEITGCPSGMETDHIDRDGLNNQRFNLRVCLPFQNKRNVGIRKDNTSGYKGVSLDKRRNTWCASIRFEERLIHIGSYKSKEEAALAYDEFASKLFGEFAVLNFGETMK